MMGRHALIAIRMAIATIIAFGLIYPLVMTGIAQIAFPRQANGSLVRDGGTVVGSQLIGQQFSKPEYFHPRPSAAGSGYDAASSGGSNLGSTNKKLVENVRQRTRSATQENPGMGRGQAPVDMVTASGSGLDPDISVANAYAQMPRVAKERGLTEDKIKRLVDANTTERQLGFLGERRVNVLRINRALDGMSGTGR